MNYKGMCKIIYEWPLDSIWAWLSKYVSSRNKGFGRTYCKTLDTYIVFIAYTNYLKYHVRDKKEAIL